MAGKEASEKVPHHVEIPKGSLVTRNFCAPPCTLLLKAWARIANSTDSTSAVGDY
jgi:hypothetical protein